MNGKQAKVLRRMRATKPERRRWRAMTADQRGWLRAAFEACPWMIYPDIGRTAQHGREWLRRDRLDAARFSGGL